MANLDPKLEVEIEFLFADLFHPEDLLAQWIANLSRAANDLLLAHRRLDATLAGESLTGHEAIYDITQVASHAFELVKFIQGSQVTKIEAFCQGLGEKTTESRDRALDLVNAPAAPGTKSFKAKLASARDQGSHYSNLDHKLLVGALTRLGEPDEDGGPSIGKVQIGKTLKDFYADFASMLDYQLFMPLKSDDLTPFKEFVAELRALVVPLTCFSSEAVQAYLYKYRDSLRVSPLGG